MVLTDTQWTMLEPLVEACRPHAKVPLSDLHRTVSAILWRHENGAKWRALPAELGPWWMAAQTFIRWARLGVWERLLNLVQYGGAPLTGCPTEPYAPQVALDVYPLKQGAALCTTNTATYISSSRNPYVYAGYWS
jgi:hypothetical protein